MSQRPKKRLEEAEKRKELVGESTTREREKKNIHFNTFGCKTAAFY